MKHLVVPSPDEIACTEEHAIEVSHGGLRPLTCRRRGCEVAGVLIVMREKNTTGQAGQGGEGGREGKKGGSAADRMGESRQTTSWWGPFRGLEDISGRSSDWIVWC